MTTDERKKLDEAVRLVREVEKSMGESVEKILVAPGTLNVSAPSVLMFASMELGAVTAARAALEELDKPVVPRG